MRLLRDLVGETLSDRYRIVSRLAGGGMGEVFRAHDLLLDRAVAVKVLQPSLAADPELVVRFKQEARSAARLNHPHIVGVHDWGSADEHTYYMVMEYVAGTDLREVLTLRGPLQPAQAVEVVAAVCDALEVAHRAGLVHRDIKPENILIARDGTVKVTDFGIAVVVDAELTMPGGTIPGTLRYLSPEQARGEGAGPPTDIWGAGALLFELLTGEPLFEGGGLETLQRRAFDSPRPPSELDPSLPADLDHAVQKACANVPAGRFDSAGEMAQELRLAPVESAAPLTSLLDDVTGDIRLPDMTPTTFVHRKRAGLGWKKLVPAVLLGLLLLFALIGGAAALMGPSMVEVPQVVGLDVPRARDLAAERGLEVDVAEEIRTMDAPAGEIVAQDPTGGKLEEGSVIALTVSKGPPLSKVPDVTGMQLRQARIRLNRAELEVEIESVEYSLDDKGTVISQQPESGKLEWGQTISLVVSRGPRPITVPDVAGMSLAKAEQKLRDAGFTTATTSVYSDKVKEGMVVGTDPAGGSTAGEGTEIVIQVSAGPEFQDVKMPDVRGMSVSEATAELEALGLNVRVEESCDGGTTVVETHPIPGTIVRENSTVALFVC